MQHVAPALDEPLEFFLLCATACVRHSDSTWTVKNKDAELDVVTSLTLSHITTNNFVTAALRNGAVLPRGGHLFHDFITQI